MCTYIVNGGNEEQDGSSQVKEDDEGEDDQHGSSLVWHTAVRFVLLWSQQLENFSGWLALPLSGCQDARCCFGWKCLSVFMLAVRQAGLHTDSPDWIKVSRIKRICFKQHINDYLIKLASAWKITPLLLSCIKQTGKTMKYISRYCRSAYMKLNQQLKL